MTETPGYFPTAAGIPLYGVFHRPASPARVPVVVAPALFEERKSAYAALASLARALASAGHATLRFDYRGSGESGGDPALRRWRDLTEDLAAACEALRASSGQAGGVALVGLRLGGTLCLLEANRLRAERVVALAPVANGPAQERLWRMRSKIREELTAGAASAVGEAPAGGGGASVPGEAMDLDGFSVGRAFLDDLKALDLLNAPPLEMPGLIVQLSHRTEAAPETERLREAMGSRCEVAALRMEPFWDRLDDVDTRPLNERVIQALGKMQERRTE